VGTKSNRDGIGALVTVSVPGGRKQQAVVKSGSSYCSQSELPVTFGLGAAARADVEVRWPSGRVDRVAGAAANATLTVQEEKGAIDTAPWGRK
jgi:hypothetical protein